MLYQTVNAKCLRLLFIAMLIYGSASAQFTIGRQKTIGGNSIDYLKNIFFTKDGGLIAGGESWSDSSFEKTANNKGYNDYWLVKLNKAGKIQWDKTFGTSREDFFYSMRPTKDGGYILGGFSASDISGDKTENSRGSDDYWIVKCDSLGNIQWDKTIGGENTDDLNCLQQLSDGGYILGGQSNSNKSGEKTENARGEYDYWVVKLDSLGNVQWDKTIGGNSFDYLISLQQTKDGGLILGGFSSSDASREKTENNRGFEYSYDYWIVKLNRNGKIEWDKTIGGNNIDELTSVQQTIDGGYIAGGWSNSNISSEKTENSRGADDYWIVKLNSEGNIEWDKTIGGNDNDELLSFLQTKDRGFILGGVSRSDISGEKSENSKGGGDYWIVKLDDTGQIKWDKTIGGNETDWLTSIKEIEKDHYALGGFSASGISGDKTQKSRGMDDFWLVELRYNPQQDNKTITSSNSTNPISINKSDFSVFPNPAKNKLYVRINGKVNLSLADQTGRVLLTQIIDNYGEINVSHLAPGLYYVSNEVTGIVKKIVISR